MKENELVCGAGCKMDVGEVVNNDGSPSIIIFGEVNVLERTKFSKKPTKILGPAIKDGGERKKRVGVGVGVGVGGR